MFDFYTRPAALWTSFRSCLTYHTMNNYVDELNNMYLRWGVSSGHCLCSHHPHVVLEWEWLISDTGICSHGSGESLCHLYFWSCCLTPHQQPAAEGTVIRCVSPAGWDMELAGTWAHSQQTHEGTVHPLTLDDAPNNLTTAVASSCHFLKAVRKNKQKNPLLVMKPAPALVQLGCSVHIKIINQQFAPTPMLNLNVFSKQHVLKVTRLWENSNKPVSISRGQR